MGLLFYTRLDAQNFRGGAVFDNIMMIISGPEFFGYVSYAGRESLPKFVGEGLQ